MMLARAKTFGEQLLYLWKTLWHPLDSVYDIVYKGKGSILSAIVIYFIYYVVIILNKIFTGFIFNPYGLNNTSIFNLFITFVLPVFVFVVGNCLVSSITQGQGRYRSVFITTAYTLAPYIILSFPIAIMSNGFSMAEKAIFDVINGFIVGWTGLSVYLGVMEVHGYSIPEAFFNLIAMVFTSAMVLVFAVAFYGITFQSINFLVQFLREAIGYV